MKLPKSISHVVTSDSHQHFNEAEFQNAVANAQTNFWGADFVSDKQKYQ